MGIDGAGKLIADLKKRCDFYKLLVKEYAILLERNMKPSSVAIWHGFSQIRSDPKFCDGRDSGTAICVREGLKEARAVLGGKLRRNFFVNIGCPTSSAPRRD